MKTISIIILFFAASIMPVHASGDNAEYQNLAKTQERLGEKTNEIAQDIYALLKDENIDPETREKLRVVLDELRSSHVAGKMAGAADSIKKKLRFESMQKVEIIISDLDNIIALFDKTQKDPSPITNLDLGLPLTYKKMTLFPIYSKQKKTASDFITLDEGLESGKVTIEEKNSVGSVPELTVTNKSGKSLYIMAGEVLYGGYQDRMINRDIIIEATGKPRRLPVNCVERGRWSRNEKKSFTDAKALAQRSIRIEANALRSQTGVWKRVAEHNKTLAPKASSSSYKKALTAARTANNDIEQIENLLDKRGEVVGLAIGINGELQSIDVFASPALFRKMRRKILRSYLLDLMVAPGTNKKIASMSSQIVLNALKSSGKAKLFRRELASLSRIYKTTDEYICNANSLPNNTFMRFELLRKTYAPGNTPPRPPEDPAKLTSKLRDFGWARLSPSQVRRASYVKIHDRFVTKYDELLRRYYKYMSKVETDLEEARKSFYK